MVDQGLNHKEAYMCKNDFKPGGIELDSDVVGKEPVNSC